MLLATPISFNSHGRHFTLLWMIAIFIQVFSSYANALIGRNTSNHKATDIYLTTVQCLPLKHDS